MIVTVLVGARYGQREKVFDAVIDKVEVKPLGDLSATGDRARQPGLRDFDEFGEWLGRASIQPPQRRRGRDAVIRFSQIIGTMF